MKRIKSLVSKKIFYIILSVILCLCSIGFFAYIGRSVISNASSFSVNGITLTESGDGSRNVLNANSLNGSVSGYRETVMGMGCDRSRTGEIVFTCEEGNEVELFFHFKVTTSGDGNILKIDNTEYSGEGDFSKNISQNESVKIQLTSGEGNGKSISVLIQDIKLVNSNDFDVTFRSSENGSYSVATSDGSINEIVDNTDVEMVANGEKQFTLTAIPDENFSLLGWYLNDEFYSTSEQINLIFLGNSTIYPRFMPEGLALFEFENKQFYDLKEAIAACNSSSASEKIIFLIKNGSLSVGDYIIPSNVTLFIPRDDQRTVIKPDDQSLVGEKSEGVTKPYEFARLEIPDSTTITFESGAQLYVSGKTIAGQPESSKMNGGYGHIILKGNESKIIMKAGAILYCYGYITGLGLVESLSGSVVYEFFQIYGWRGGSTSLELSNNKNKVFLVNQYYIQNVEARIRFHPGAKSSFITGVELSLVGLQTRVATLIGDDGLFRISNGFIDRVYDATDDKICYTVYGNATLSSISIDVPMINLNSADYVLPITNNFEINVTSDSEIIIGQDVALLPGTSLNIEEGAKMTFTENVSLYVYDNDWWFNRKFGYIGLDINPIKYTATLNGSSKRTIAKDSPDAEININGEIILNNGASIYTTVGENETSSENITNAANIHSSQGTGKITFVSKLGTNTETFQITQSGSTPTFVSIPIKNSLLKNKDGSYFDPVKEGATENASVLYDSELGKWYINTGEATTYKVKYVDEISGLTKEGEYTAGQDFTLPSAESLGFSHPLGYSLKYWRLTFGNTNYFYKPEETIKINYQDITLFAVWGGWIFDTENNKYKYVDYNDGTYLRGLKQVISLNNNETKSICLFDENGFFLEEYNGTYLNNVDNRIYYLKNGEIVEEEGLVMIITSSDPLKNDYIYITENNYLLCGGEYFINTSSESALPSGFYNFDDNGYIVREDSNVTSSDQQVYVKENVTYIDGIRVSCGLFADNGYLYFSDVNGNIIVNKTIYVTDTNGIKIEPGLYYFNSEGKMCDEKLIVIEANSL